MAHVSNTVSELLEQLHFSILVGGTALIMMYSMARIIRSRISLTDWEEGSQFGKLAAMYLLWTTQKDESDCWFRDEPQPLANENDLHLHH